MNITFDIHNTVIIKIGKKRDIPLGSYNSNTQTFEQAISTSTRIKKLYDEGLIYTKKLECKTYPKYNNETNKLYWRSSQYNKWTRNITGTIVGCRYDYNGWHYQWHQPPSHLSCYYTEDCFKKEC